MRRRKWKQSREEMKPNVSDQSPEKLFNKDNVVLTAQAVWHLLVVGRCRPFAVDHEAELVSEIKIKIMYKFNC